MRAWHNVRECFGVIVLIGVGIVGVRAAIAATWIEPSQQPPAANPPGFVWAISPSGTPQSGGQFHVEGSGKLGGTLELGGAFRTMGIVQLGSAILDLGSAAGGQNLLYGSTKYSGMHPDDALFLLQTASDAALPVLRDRLRVDRDGNLATSGAVTSDAVSAQRVCIGAACRTDWPAGSITGVTAGSNLSGGGTTGNVTLNLVSSPNVNGSLSVGGNLTVKGCFGPILRGATATASQGNAGGYVQANGRCPTGQHICSTAEVLQSIACGAFSAAGVSTGAELWVSNLAPSLPTPTNDCDGWTSVEYHGIKWRMDTTTGGAAYAEPCTTALPFACCG